MYLIYIGPHEEVEVPHDLAPEGSYFAKRGGPAVDFPDDIAKGLLAQGEDSSPDNPQHQPQWRKANSKEADAAKKAAEHDDVAAAAKDGNA